MTKLHYFSFLSIFYPTKQKKKNFFSFSSSYFPLYQATKEKKNSRFLSSHFFFLLIFFPLFFSSQPSKALKTVRVLTRKKIESFISRSIAKEGDGVNRPLPSNPFLSFSLTTNFSIFLNDEFLFSTLAFTIKLQVISFSPSLFPNMLYPIIGPHSLDYVVC